MNVPRKPLSPRDAYQQLLAAKNDPETFWEQMTIQDTADGMFLHPLIVGLMFELPYADSGRAVWTVSERDAWIELAEKIVDMCFATVPDQDDPEAGVFVELVERMLKPEVVPNDQESDPPSEAGSRLEAEPDTKSVSTNGHSSIDRLDFKRRCLEIARENEQNCDRILGYKMTPESVIKNRKARGWDRAFLAESTGVHVNAVERAETGSGWQSWQGARLAAAFVLTEDGEHS